MKKLKYKSKKLLSSEILDMMIEHLRNQDLSKDDLIDLWFIVDELKTKKVRIDITGTGNIDECDKCGEKYCSGVVAFDYKQNDLVICNKCLEKYYTVNE